ncbi:hypothetical protein LJC16_04190 [Bacteroidales bacterium OttesenSCG-928-C19]|nr:hypothetical protein [Bacteroidales bacterium OttesenSCG-928-C19]
MYLLITSILIAITIFFAVFPKFKKFRDRNAILTTFIITLVATGAGVFLALYFSNKEEEKKEKMKTFNILAVSKAELNGVIIKVIQAEEALKMINDSSFTFQNYLDNFRIEKPYNLQALLDNGSVMQGMSVMAPMMFTLWNDNVIYSYKKLENSTEKSVAQYTYSLIEYWRVLETIDEIINLEVDFINGKQKQNTIWDSYVEIGAKHEQWLRLGFDDRYKELINLQLKE